MTETRGLNSNCDIPGVDQSQLMTNFRKTYGQTASGINFSTICDNGIGANIVKYNGLDSVIMISESPLLKSLDLWLDKVFENNISGYVTLTNDLDHSSDQDPNWACDLNPDKLKFYRNGEKINLHHAENISNHSERYKISDVKTIIDDENMSIYSYEIENKDGKKLNLKHFKIKGISDDHDSKGIAQMSRIKRFYKFAKMAELISEYSSNLNIAFNCFMGVARSRFAAICFIEIIGLKSNLSHDKIDSTINDVINNTVSFGYIFPNETKLFSEDARSVFLSLTDSDNKNSGIDKNKD